MCCSLETSHNRGFNTSIGLLYYYSRSLRLNQLGDVLIVDINYKFVPQYKSEEARFKSDVVSYAGKLLEIIGASTIIVTLDSERRPVVLQTEQPLIDALDVTLDTY